MHVDGYARIPDIPGESRRQGHEDEIEIHGLTFGMGAPEGRGGGTRRGRVDLDPVVLSKHYDRASPSLKRALADNRRLAEVVVSLVRAVEGQTSDYLVLTLEDAAVVRYDLAPAPDQDNALEERVAFSYRTITFRYDGQYEVELDVLG